MTALLTEFPFSVSLEQQRHLAKWLTQWRMKLDFREEAPAGKEDQAVLGIAETASGFRSGASQHGRGVHPISEEPAVRPGQIRLFEPSVLLATERPMYFAVLSEWESDLVLIAPYSEFTAPAVRGELLTERDGLALKVLCLWNTRSIPVTLAGQSWFVDNLTERERSETWSVFRHITVGASLPSSLVDRVGAPIRMEEDPRIQYQAEEAALLAPLTAEAMRLVENVEHSSQEVGPDEEERTATAPSLLVFPAWTSEALETRELRLAAAGTGGVTGAKSTYWIPDASCFLVVRLHADLETCGILVLDADGELTDALDGGIVVAGNDEKSTPITHGQTTISLDAASKGLRLLNSSGHQMKLEEKDGG